MMMMLMIISRVIGRTKSNPVGINTKKLCFFCIQKVDIHRNSEVRPWQYSDYQQLTRRQRDNNKIYKTEWTKLSNKMHKKRANFKLEESGGPVLYVCIIILLFLKWNANVLLIAVEAAIENTVIKSYFLILT